jgi:hypothetical protein
MVAAMALTTQSMTAEQRKSVALEYLKAFDNGGVTSTGGSILDLFADDAQVYFPKWGLATGRDKIGKLFGDVGGTISSCSGVRRCTKNTGRADRAHWVTSGHPRREAC